MSNDEFDNLIIKEEDVINKKIITEILSPYIKISTNGEIIFDSNYFKLDNKRKIIVYLLTRKVMKLKNIGNLESEEAGPREIANNTGIAFGSVGWVVRVIDGHFIKSMNGQYSVPNYFIEKIKDLFKEGGI